MKPLHIEAEAFTAMSGVTTEPTKDIGGGSELAYIDSGDWAEYSINIDTPGTYLITFRFAKPYTDFSTIDVISGGNVIGTVPIKTTKDWQKWDATGTNINLAAGQQTLRLRFTSGNFNLNWFELTLVSEATQQAPAASNKAGAISVDSFTLINATNNQEILTIANGSTLNLATLGRSLNIRANTSPADVGSVVFSLTGAQSKSQTETVAPYALFGDNNGVYLSWTPVVGNYVLTATPTRGAQGNGPQGNALAVSFTVTDVPVARPVPPIPTVPPVTPAPAPVPPVVTPTPTPQPQPVPSPTRVITVKATFTAAPVNPAATFSDLGNDKRVGFMFTKDDGGIGDYSVVNPVVNGGVGADGVTYPGITYPDGAGSVRNVGYTLAINGRGNALRDGSNPTVTSWKQYKEILAHDNICLANHSADHGNTPTALQQLQDNETIIKTQLGVDMRTVVLPAGLPGFVAAGIQLGYILWSSEGYGGPDNNSADGYVAEISWGETFDIASLGNKHLIGSRYNFDGQLVAGILKLKAWIDSKFKQAKDANKKQVFSAFSHGPLTGDETKALNELFQYIANHPENKGDVWFPNLQQFAEYLEVKKLAVKSTPVINGNTISFTIDLSAVPAKNKYKDMSLKLSGGTLQNIEVTGADNFTFNSSTGLLNIYKGSTVSKATTAPPVVTPPPVVAPPVTPAPAPSIPVTPAPVPPVVTPTPPPVVNVPPVVTPQPAPAPSTGKTVGEIPYLSYWAFAMDNSNQNLGGFFDGNLSTNVDLGFSKMTDRPDIVFPFPPQMEVEIDEIWFGDGQHEQTGAPMQSWTIDTVTKQKVAAFTFDGKNPPNTWQKNKFAKTVRTDYFAMQWTYPIPTQLKFIGKYKPYTPKPYVVPKVPVERVLGSVAYSWDLQKPSAGGLDAAKGAIIDSCGFVRLYMDMGTIRMPNGLFTFQPCCSGAWQTDLIVADLKSRGIKVLFCLKGQEAATYYPDAAEQIAIRYGNNPNVPDSQTKIFQGTVWPANQVKKGLNGGIAIQLGNEQWRTWKGRCNVATQTNFEGYMTPFETAVQFKACYDKIKAVDPTIEVVLGGMNANTPGILQAIIYWCNLYNGGKLVFDSVSYHEYLNQSNSGQNTGSSPKGVEPERFNYAMFSHVARFKQVLSEASLDKELSLYITETGYGISSVNPEQTAVPTKTKSTFRVQADWILRSAMEALAAGCAGLAAYQLYDDGNYVGFPDRFMNWDLCNGIAQQHRDGSVGLRPTTDAFAQMMKLLKGYIMESRDISNPLIIVYKFVKPGANTIYSVHKISDDDSTTPYSLKVSGASAKQYTFNFGNMSRENYVMDGTTQAYFDRYTKGTGVLDSKIITSVNGLVNIVAEETPKFIEMI